MVRLVDSIRFLELSSQRVRNLWGKRLDLIDRRKRRPADGYVRYDGVPA